MKSTIWMIYFVLWPALGSAKEIQVGFQDLKTLVKGSNERVLAATLEESAAKSREGHLARSFLPRLEARIAQERFKTGSQGLKTQPDYGAEATVNLYNGGRDRLKEDGNRLRAERRSFETKVSVADELARARELYWFAVFQKNLIVLFKEMDEVNSGNLKAAQRRVRSGVATESDRLEFEMRAIDLKRERAEAELGLRSVARDLLVLIGQDPEDTLVPKDELNHIGEWESEIQHTHQDHDFLVKPAQLFSQEADTAARAAGRAWVPRLDAYASWNEYSQREEDPAEARERREGVLGIRLSLDVLDGFHARREAQALRHEAESARMMASYQDKKNEAHVAKEFDELKFLHDRVHEADENISSAQRYYRITQSEYARGVKNSPDVLGASQKLFAMKSKRLEMIRDFQIARSHVLSKIGK